MLSCCSTLLNSSFLEFPFDDAVWLLQLFSEDAESFASVYSKVDRNRYHIWSLEYSLNYSSIIKLSKYVLNDYLKHDLKY